MFKVTTRPHPEDVWFPQLVVPQLEKKTEKSFYFLYLISFVKKKLN